MQLTLVPVAAESPIVMTLPDDLLWSDEFKWSPVSQVRTYTLTGAMILEVGTKLAGRPITLEAPADMAWVPRSTIEILRIWSGMAGRTFTLTFTYPTDTRSFTVVFDQSGNAPIEGGPVMGFPTHKTTDWFIVKLKLIEL